jgi:hypothetical protein
MAQSVGSVLHVERGIQNLNMETAMIETIVKPQSLDNDVAVMKIIQLMGQLSLNDLSYILQLVAKVYLATERAQEK